MGNKIKNLSVIGFGNLGKQIAERAALYDYQVTIYDINPIGIKEFVHDARLRIKEKALKLLLMKL
jgi:3-hydroxyacyl-CoA dehydrogenase